MRSRFKMDIHPFRRVFLKVCRQDFCPGETVFFFQKGLPVVQNSVVIAVHKPASEPVVRICAGSRHQASFLHSAQRICAFCSLFRSIVNQGAGFKASVSLGLDIRGHSLLCHQASMGACKICDICPQRRHTAVPVGHCLTVIGHGSRKVVSVPAD